MIHMLISAALFVLTMLGLLFMAAVIVAVVLLRKRAAATTPAPAVSPVAPVPAAALPTVTPLIAAAPAHPLLSALLAAEQAAQAKAKQDADALITKARNDFFSALGVPLPTK